MKQLLHSISALLWATAPIISTPAYGKNQLFVARHVHPLTINEDGSQLLALNSENGRLSVFATGEAPLLIQEIPVGMVPVSVRLRTPGEAWVVNELSDSISVVSLSRGVVIDTIQTGDEPGDVVFQNGQAFVSISRENKIEVFDVSTRTKVGDISLEGLFPRSLAISPDGEKIYVSFLHTSNGTTILPRDKAPPQDTPAWINPDLPDPPQTSRIVSTGHAEISYEVIDHDVAIISANNFTNIEYLGGLGTNIFNLAITDDGTLLAPNSEARNLIFFEPQLRGRFAKSRLTIVQGEYTTQLDLNPDPDEVFPEIDHAAAETALAQVMTTLPESDGTHAWLASFGSDRIARLRLDDQEIIGRIDLRENDSSSERNALTVRGPRGLAIHPTLPHLYVLNKLSHTLTTIDRESLSVISETPLGSFSDLDPGLKIGRGILSDARLSGNGSVSCATCHIDLERDGIAWDLGNPSSEMLTVKGAFLSLHLPDTFADRVMHPMKGPMVTQTLIGLSEQTKLHWRGDKPTIQSFNSTFPNLLGGSELPGVQMDLVAAYLDKLRHHPNPHLKLDRNLPEEVQGGNPTDGIAVFTLFDNHCSACHSLPSGTSNNIDIPSSVGSFQPLKDAPLRTTYHRLNLNPTPGARSLSGFGMGSDGSLHELPIGHPYSLHILDDIDRPLEVREKEKRDLAAFILAFDTGTAPAIGRSISFHSNESSHPGKLGQLSTLESQASLGIYSEVGVIAHGLIDGQRRSFHFDPETSRYQPDLSSGEPLSKNALLGSLNSGDALTFTGVPVGKTRLLSTDRNGNEVPDGSEPTPPLRILPDQSLLWPSSASNWFPEFSTNFLDWHPLTTQRQQSGDSIQHSPLRETSKVFFRLRPTQ